MNLLSLGDKEPLGKDLDKHQKGEQWRSKETEKEREREKNMKDRWANGKSVERKKEKKGNELRNVNGGNTLILRKRGD